MAASKDYLDPETKVKRKSAFQSVKSNDYSPRSIQQIFQDSLKPNRKSKNENLFPEPPYVQETVDPDSFFIEINSIDVELRAEKAVGLSQIDREQLNKLLISESVVFDGLSESIPYELNLKLN